MFRRGAILGRAQKKDPVSQTKRTDNIFIYAFKKHCMPEKLNTNLE